MRMGMFENGVVKNERGQVLLIGLLVILGLTLAAIGVANVGIMVAEKIHLQDTADAAAYSAAVQEARYMNLAAYINRSMVANYNAMAFNTALWATFDAYDHGSAVFADLLYKISFICFASVILSPFAQPVDQVADLMRDSVHHYMHDFNHEMNELFAQDDDAQDLNQYIEKLNVYVLTMYQGLLYAGNQSIRHEIIQKVANKMDPDIVTSSVLGLGAEAVSYDELARAVDFALTDPEAQGQPFTAFNKSFDSMHGKNAGDNEQPYYLGAVTEASLDRFTAGNTRDGTPDGLRNLGTGNILGGTLTSLIETALDLECYASCTVSWLWGGCNCNARVRINLGSSMRDGQENKADEDHVPVIANRRMREVNMFGSRVNVQGVPSAGAISYMLGDQGHTSGDIKNDVANVANATWSLNHDWDSDRASECVEAGCVGSIVGPPVRGLNTMNILAGMSMIPPLPLPPWVDDHWDGSFKDIEPVHSWEVFDPGQGKVAAGKYLANLASEGIEEGVPKYDWIVDLEDVGIPVYYYPDDGSEVRPVGSSGGGGDKNRLTGPSIAVVAVKSANKLQGLKGLGIGNRYSMSAVSRAQVYYVRNPNRPDELPSLFNPHWVARLAPLKSDDTPVLLRKGLPYLSSVGIPIEPTH